MKERFTKDGKWQIGIGVTAIIVAIITLYFTSSKFEKFVDEIIKTITGSLSQWIAALTICAANNKVIFIVVAVLLLILFLIIVIFLFRKYHHRKDNWIDEVNRLYPSEAEVYGVIYKNPILKYDGPYPLTNAQKEIAFEILFKMEQSAKLRKKKVTNDPHAILNGKIERTADNISMHYRTLMYNEIVVLRMVHLSNEEYSNLKNNSNFKVGELKDAKGDLIIFDTKSDEGIYINIGALDKNIRKNMNKEIYGYIFDKQGKPEVLSAGAVIVCPERKEIFIHHRSMNSATYPGSFHTIGGAYAPPELLVENMQDSSLIATAHREVREESQIQMSWNPRTRNPMIYSKELSTGFIQLMLLGGTFPESDVNVQVNVEDWRNTPQVLEGRPKHVHYDDLKDNLFADERWVPSGILHTLSWLALGAPGCPTNVRYSGCSPIQLYNNYIKSHKK